MKICAKDWPLIFRGGGGCSPQLYIPEWQLLVVEHFQITYVEQDQPLISFPPYGW